MKTITKTLLLATGLALLIGAIWLVRKQPVAAKSESKGVLISTPSKGDKSQNSTPAPSISVNVQSNTMALSSAVRLILDEQADYNTRLTAIHEAVTHLSDADRQALYTFLLQRSPLDGDQHNHVLKNMLMDGLCALNPPPTGLGDMLAQLYQDKSQNVVLRDYAVQHMIAFYEQMEKTPDDGKPAKQGELSQVRDVLWEALTETDSSIAGSALLGLEHLSGEQSEFDRNRIAKAALQLAGDNNTGELARITAFQVCAQTGLQDAVPLLEQAAQQGQSIPLRISAIGALGTMGNAQAVPLLNSLLNGTEERLKLPARQALERIELKQRLACAGNK